MQFVPEDLSYRYLWDFKAFWDSVEGLCRAERVKCGATNLLCLMSCSECEYELFWTPESHMYFAWEANFRSKENKGKNNNKKKIKKKDRLFISSKIWTYYFVWQARYKG